MELILIQSTFHISLVFGKKWEDIDLKWILKVCVCVSVGLSFIYELLERAHLTYNSKTAIYEALEQITGYLAGR